MVKGWGLAVNLSQQRSIRNPDAQGTVTACNWNYLKNVHKAELMYIMPDKLMAMSRIREQSSA